MFWFTCVGYADLDWVIKKDEGKKDIDFLIIEISCVDMNELFSCVSCLVSNVLHLVSCIELHLADRVFLVQL